MRSSRARRRNDALIPGTAIAHVDPVAFFIIGMEFRGGDGEPALGSVLNKDSGAGRVVIQGFRIEGGLDEETALLAERERMEAA